MAPKKKPLPVTVSRFIRPIAPTQLGAAASNGIVISSNFSSFIQRALESFQPEVLKEGDASPKRILNRNQWRYNFQKKNAF